MVFELKANQNHETLAILTVLLYALALLILTLPVVLLAFGNWGLKNSPFGIKDALAIYAGWAYWLWLAVLVAGQFCCCSAH